MSKINRYSLKSIRRNYTYSVYEIAERLNVTPDTVFRWIRNEGLVRIPGTQKFHVHSSELIKFLEKKNSENKRPCKDGEIYCLKCRKPRHPTPESLKAQKQPNKTIKVLGKCSVCGTRMNKPISLKKWTRAHPLHPGLNAPATTPKGEQVSPRECQSRKGGQLCLSLTP